MAVNGVTTVGNRTFLFGAASGINTEALIDVAYKQRTREADKIDVRMDNNVSKNEAYSELQTLSQKVADSMALLKRNYSVLNTTASLFDSRVGSISSSSATQPGQLMSVSIDPGTTLGTYEIEIIDKAKAHRVGSNTSTSNPNGDLGFNGSFSIGLQGKTASTVNVTADMSLNELAAAVNAQSSTTGVSASIVKVSATSYQMIMTGADTAKQIEVTNITGDDAMAGLGFMSGGAFTNVIQPAQQAKIKFDNIEIVSDTNNFDGIVTGVNMTVKNAEPGTTITLDVENDTASVKDALTTFVESYNEFRAFVLKNQEVSSDGAVSKDAILYGDTHLKSLGMQMQNVISQSFGEGNGAFSNLRDIGITLNTNSMFEIDQIKLDAALLNNFDKVRSVFETSVTTSTPDIRMMSNNSKKSLNFALEITMSGADIGSVSVGGNSDLFEISGKTIKGKAGTDYEGMSFTYIGTSNQTINIGVRQGFADLMNSTIKDFSDTVTGSIQKEKINNETLNKDMALRADRIRERAEDYRNKLIDRYAALETQMNQAQSTLTRLRAILGTDQDKDN